MLLDLHGGDQVEALEPFAIYDASPVEERAHELAVAFNLPYVVREEPQDGRPRRDDDERRRAGGHPGRDRGGGRPRAARGERDVACSSRACGTRCGSWGCCRASRSRRPRTARRSAASSGCARSEAGWWDWAVEAGEEVAEGQVLGRIRDLWGDVREEIVAPQDGVVLFITSSPAVTADGLLLGLGADIGPTAVAPGRD